jgi:hypothetical protein|tara:strand:+ start:113 stop:337 length:225 start_codon:yes stop_codon:yes gene_type:complete
MINEEYMKNLTINAFGDLVERTDYGNHKNQLNLQDKLNEIQKDMDDWFVEMDKAIYGAPNELTEDLIQVNGEMS